MKTVFILAAMTLSGCALSPLGGVASGGATYSYTKTQDSCTVLVNSAREISDITLNISSDCSLSTAVGNANGNQAAEVLDRLLNIPGAQ